MYKIFKFLMLFLLVFTPLISVDAQRGCCSWHGGVAGCNSDGRQICNDGTLSPSCTCDANPAPTITYDYGCTDPDAKNYDISADKDDGSCKYYKYGCTDKKAKNYDSSADKNDGSCEYYKYGCMDKEAKNYDSYAEKDDGSCEYYILGCMDKDATNYNNKAEKEDNSCEYDDTGSGVIGLLALGGAGFGTYKYIKNKKSKKSTKR